MYTIARLFVFGCLLTVLRQVSLANGETPGERFQKTIERETEYCATHKIKPTNRRCDITKLQPADPLATEEGRFAHSIKIEIRCSAVAIQPLQIGLQIPQRLHRGPNLGELKPHPIAGALLGKPSDVGPDDRGNLRVATRG